MRLSLSARPIRHVVLTCTPTEANSTHIIIRDQILFGSRRPVREQNNGQVLYKFAPRYLPILLDTLAQAERSPAVERWVARRDDQLYGNIDLDFTVPGFRGELYPFQRWGVAVARQHPHFIVNDDIGCVAPETLISTELGDLPIADIVNHRLNVRVWTKASDGQWSLKNIVRWMRRPQPSRFVAVGRLRLTPDHGILTGRGFVAASRVLPTDGIAVGVVQPEWLDASMVLQEDGRACDGGLSSDGYVYNLTIEDHHNYVAEGIVVANCGKTITGLSVMALHDAFPLLVVCPSSVKYVWGEHVEQFFPKLTCVVVQGSARLRAEQIALGCDILVINYDALRLHPELADKPWQGIILDEGHRIRNTDTQQTQAAHRLHAEYQLVLSGTPLLNGRLEELFSMLHWQYPDEFPGDMSVTQPDWAFRRRYAYLRKGQIVGYRRVGELRDKLHARSIRRRKQDVLPELPDIVHQTRYIDLTSEQRKLYNEIRKDFWLRLNDGTVKHIRDIRVWVGRLKQACFSPELYGGTKASAKIGETKELLEELTAAGHKTIIFSEWAKATRILQRELSSYSMSYVDGSLSLPLRKKQIARFQRGDSDIYIGTVRANMEGITLHAANHVLFTDQEWVPAWNEQAAGRAHRIGQKDTVTVITLVGRDTIEERLQVVLAEKSAMNDLMVERGQRAAVPKSVRKLIVEML